MLPYYASGLGRNHPLKVAGNTPSQVPGKPFIGQRLTRDTLLQNHSRGIPGEPAGYQVLLAAVHCRSLMLESWPLQEQDLGDPHTLQEPNEPFLTSMSLQLPH